MSKLIYAIAVSAQATFDMHSLNNEGGEGNQIQTRMVNIIGADGKLHNVNAISGDMFKHIQAKHLHRIAMEAKLPLSEGVKSFNANRINYDIEMKNELFQSLQNANGSLEELDIILKQCAITDLEGILVTAGNRSLPRKSVVDFGWVIGIPDFVDTDTYFHVKYVPERKTSNQDNSEESDEVRSHNTGQAIFHRPASSGIYAIVLNLEAARVGLNDISQVYAIDEEERTKRFKALLESILYTFVEPNGAMRNTQNPHIVDFKGVVSISYDIAPAPCISPLKPEFENDIKQIAAAINSLRPNAVEIKSFTSLGEFAGLMADLIQSASPFAIAIP
jgi:CRISPR-associated protein Cst2